MQKIPFSFDLVTANGTYRDSITTVIRSQKVNVEQQEMTATKITFEQV